MLRIIVELLEATLRLGAPLIFAALGGVFSERSGVTNIGLEGIMVVGAFFSIAATLSTNNPWIGILAGMLAGAVVAAIHAVMSITLKADQIIAGTAINLFATGLAGFLIYLFYQTHGQTNSVKGLPYPTNFLQSIPVIGSFLASLNMFVYLAILLVIIAHYVLYKTPLGLRIRSVGEHPRAADTVGVNVYKIRYLCVILSGVLGGIGGTALSLGNIRVFSDGMTAGKGFIAIAAMIFGNWKPFGAMWACLLFGLSSAFSLNAQTYGWNLPVQFWSALPYVLTMLVMAGFIGRTQMPAADGAPYDKSDSR